MHFLRDCLFLARSKCAVFCVLLASILSGCLDASKTSYNSSEHSAKRFDCTSADAFHANDGALKLHRRSSIIDRRGKVLAYDEPVTVAKIDLSEIESQDKTLQSLSQLVPEVGELDLTSTSDVNHDFTFPVSFDQYEALKTLNLSGVELVSTSQRTYPYAPTISFIGTVDERYCGVSGLEKFFNHQLESGVNPLQISLDLNVQSILLEVLEETVFEWEAEAGVAILFDVKTSEIVGMASVQKPSSNRQHLNLATQSTYEFGSVFKVFAMASALENQVTHLDDEIDVTEFKIDGVTIRDWWPHSGSMNPKEILSESSNVGAAKLALRLPVGEQQRSLKSMGLLDNLHVELSENEPSSYPSIWDEMAVVTVSFGHGISVTPLHLINAFSSVVNGGEYLPATLLKSKANGRREEATRVISETTSDQLVKMLEFTVYDGTGGNAASEVYRVGGKTGTAEKPTEEGYVSDARIASFMGAFPIDDPRYAVLVMIDRPNPKYSYGYATGGWVAAPAFKNIVERVGPILQLPSMHKDQ